MFRLHQHGDPGVSFAVSEPPRQALGLGCAIACGIDPMRGDAVAIRIADESDDVRRLIG